MALEAVQDVLETSEAEEMLGQEFTVGKIETTVAPGNVDVETAVRVFCFSL